MVSTLDMEKLRKVRALMDGAKTDGERQAAKSKAEALAALERHMDRTAAPSVEGMRARLEWLAHLNDRGFSRDIHDDEALIATLRADFETIAAGIQPAPQDGPQRPAQRRAAVLDLLTAAPGLSDREIAHRLGCSPQTVGNLRRKARAHDT